MNTNIQIQPTTVTLNNGLVMPQIGLGVLKAQEGGEVERAVLAALDSGYRMIDTAAKYGNEKGVGDAIRQSGIDRNDLFLTTKVWNSDQGYDTTLTAFEESLERLQTNYVDLYLVHWPVKGKYIETYRTLEEIYDSGRAKAIGVSNFQIHHLEDLMANTSIVPAVNQIEIHPHLQQTALVNFAQQHNIVLEAWRPIMMGEVLQLPVLQQIGKQYGKSAVQVTLRWLIQRGIVVIPKSVTPSRIAQNLDVFDFELSEMDMQQIAALNRNRRLGPDPDNFNF